MTSLSLSAGRTTVRLAGRSSGLPLVLVHGNLATSLLYSALMDRLPADVFAVAIDMRGYGDWQGSPIDATAGLHSYAQDLKALLSSLNIPKAHFLGWSLGGAIVQTLHMTYPDLVLSTILEAPCPPYGYGGSQGEAGKANYEDFAGSGAGMISPAFVQSLKSGDLGEENPFSVRSVFNRAVWNKRPAIDLEELYLREVLKTNLGFEFYPGEVLKSSNWPGFAPGKTGLCNALSPKYLNCSALTALPKKAPILWIWGEEDRIVSDRAGGCFGTLGQKGLIPGYPGKEVFPPQPMIAQTRHLLNAYAAKGGKYREIALSGCGHSPHLEQEERFLADLVRHLNSFGPLSYI